MVSACEAAWMLGVQGRALFRGTSRSRKVRCPRGLRWKFAPSMPCCVFPEDVHAVALG